MKQNLGKLTLVSGNIYKDSRNRTIYVPKGSGIAYVINKEDSNLAELLDKRLLLVALAMLVSAMFVKWWIALIVGVAVFAVSELYMLKVFLPKQTKVDGDVEIEKSVETVISDKQAVYKDRVKTFSITLVIASIVTLIGLLTFKQLNKIQIYILTFSTLTMLASFLVEVVYLILYYVERKKKK